MTFRLGLIGNSHIAAFATGWPLVEARHPDVTLTHFAARGARLSELVVQGKALHAPTQALRRAIKWTSVGSTEIVPADFDEIWLVGLGFGIETAISPYLSCRADSHRADDARSPVSDPFFAAMMVSGLRHSVALDLYRKLRAIDDTPVRIVAQPNPSTEAMTSMLDRLAPFRLAAERGDEAILWAQFRAAVGAVAGDIDAGIAIQPDDTRERGIFTNATWGQGSIRLRRGMEAEHATGDALHMNADYGAAMLDLYLPEAMTKRG